MPCYMILLKGRSAAPIAGAALIGKKDTQLLGIWAILPRRI